MPIKPENLAQYPGGSIRSPEWLAIVGQVRERSGNRCEGCGVENGAIGVRLPDSSFMPLSRHHRPGDIVSVTVAGMTWGNAGEVPLPPTSQRLKVIRIVLTVAHLDRQLVDHSLENLRHWCQQCHNRHDAPARAITAAATRKAKREPTLLDFMEGDS